MTASYKTIEGRAIAEIVEKKSRFIGHIAHVETEEEALAFLDEIRTAHRMARHNVYAYMLREGGAGAEGRVRYSDDGEPAKTAGMPTLDVVRHAGLADVAVVTTRYFGGVLLGTGGLVRAYTAAAQAAIEAAQVVEITRCVDIVAELPYTLYEQTLRVAEAQGAHVVDAEFTDAVLVTLRMIDGTQAPLLAKLVELTRGQSEIMESEPFFGPFATSC